MNKKKTLSLLSHGAIAIGLLSSCEDIATTIDTTPDRIEIVEGSIETTYAVGDTVDYSSLQIQVYSTENDLLATVNYLNNESDFTLSEIDTSELGTYTFTVEYTYTTEEDSWDFSTSIEYYVVEPTNPENLILMNWDECSVYSEYLATKSVAGGELSSDNQNFVDNTGKFHIGNANSVNLMPTLYGLSTTSVDLTLANSLPENDIEITITDSEGNELDVSNYFTDDALANLKKYGEVKFKEDLGDVETDIVLTFSLVGEDYDEESFPDISYEISVVDGGYNITTAKELVLFDNTKNDDSYVSMKEEVLGLEEGALEDDPYYTYDAFIIFNDITIEYDDLPSYMILQEGVDTVDDIELYGSLKDYEIIYSRDASHTEATSVTLYGNYNQLTLGESFPWVLALYESNTDTSPGLPSNEDSSIDTHTALFGTADDRKVAPSGYELYFKDLQAMGNQGVSSSQVGDVSYNGEVVYTDMIRGGIMFTKGSYNFYYENMNVNNYFTVHLNNGFYSEATIRSMNYEQVELHISKSRLSDCFSSMIFNFSDGLVDIKESVLSNAGGFLVINQANAYNCPANSSNYWKWDDLTTEEKASLKGSDVYIDSASVLDNFVTGAGGWFDIYGASSIISTVLKTMISDCLHSYGKTIFVSDDTDRSVMNAIVLTMNTNMHSASAQEPGMRAKVVIGDQIYTYLGEGEDDVASALAAVVSDMTNQQNLLSLVNLLTSTSYGANFFTTYTSAMMYTYDSDGEPLYITPYATQADYSDLVFVTLESLIYQLVGSGSMSAVTKNDMASDYVALTYNLGGGQSVPSAITALLSALSSYTGEETFSIVMGLYDYAD